MRYVSPLLLVVALLIDTFFLLRRVDTVLTSLVLFFYLALSASIIVLVSLIRTGRLRQWWLLKITPLLPVVSQYAFGGLFIAFLSLYSRSAAFSFTWIFVAALAVLLVANERFVRFYLNFSFQMSIFFTVLFSFLIFYVPLVFRTIGPEMFLVSGVVSLVVIAVFLRLLAYLTPELVRDNLTTIARGIAVIFIIFNILYFSNAIPPLPLALKDAGIYHSVVRLPAQAGEGNEFHVRYEPIPWYQSYLRYNTTYHRAPSESLYAYSAVFAPSELTTTIYHEWQYYSPGSGEWNTVTMVAFPIIGGREGGYRGFSETNDPVPGKWRVNVKTEHGQIIGRIVFNVVEVSEPAALKESVR